SAPRHGPPLRPARPSSWKRPRTLRRRPATPGRCGLATGLFFLAFLERVAATAPPLLVAHASARVAGDLAQVDGGVALAPHVAAQILAPLILDRRLDREADLLLGDVHLDDLGRHALVERQL